MSSAARASELPNESDPDARLEEGRWRGTVGVTFIVRGSCAEEAAASLERLSGRVLEAVKANGLYPVHVAAERGMGSVELSLIAVLGKGEW